MLASHSDGQTEQGSPLYAALGRTLTRSVALYFSRPVRLFRPPKVSGWMILHGIASRKGEAVSLRFVKSLIDQHGFLVLPKHFLPPLAVNALLGTVLWKTYAKTSNLLENYVSSPMAIAFISGATAGGAQAVVAAPAENVRVVLEGGRTYSGWSTAWKDVFLGKQSDANMSKAQSMSEAREVRQWMKEVGEMAGRGWRGFGWGLCKDTMGFAVFFSIFELTRKIAIFFKTESMELVGRRNLRQADPYLPRVVHAASLVSGGIVAGLLYDLVATPFDNCRRVVRAQRISEPQRRTVTAAFQAVVQSARSDGLLSFFHIAPSHGTSDIVRSRSTMFLRILGRMGPWGIGFLIWETYGSSHYA